MRQNACLAWLRAKLSGMNSRPVSLWNPANILTMARLVMVPAFVWLFLGGTVETRWWATAVFVVAALTDLADGYLARRYGWITNFGKLADPIADKALVIAALVLLTWEGSLWWWVAPVIILRELGITVMRLFLAKVEVIAASWMGKWKTTTQLGFITFLLVPWATFAGQPVVTVMHWITTMLILAAVALTLWSGGQYVVAAVRGAQNRRRGAVSRT